MERHRSESSEKAGAEDHAGRTSLADAVESEAGKLHRWMPTPRLHLLSPALHRVEARGMPGRRPAEDGGSAKQLFDTEHRTQALAREWLQQQKRTAASQPDAAVQTDMASLEEVKKQPGMRHRWAPSPQQLAVKKQQMTLQAQQQAAEEQRRLHLRRTSGSHAWERGIRPRNQTSQVQSSHSTLWQPMIKTGLQCPLESGERLHPRCKRLT